MMRTILNLSLVMATVALGACGEKPQTIGAGKMDVQPYQGADNAFVASGWKAGDKTSWEQALKARALSTQNEYSKTK